MIVQWDAVSHIEPDNSVFTYEVILSEIDDSIVFQYLDMVGTLGDGSSATVGIENGTGSDGLEISFNSASISNNLAIKISDEPTFVGINPLFGTIAPGLTVDATVTFDATGLIPGADYTTDIVISSNDPDESELIIPTQLHVIGPPRITHIPLTDTIDLGPYTVAADITADFPLVRTDLIWSINGGGFQTASMAPSGGDTFEGVIPAQAVADIISYYIETEDSQGNVVTNPGGAPGTNLHTFEIQGVPLLSVEPSQLSYDLYTGDTETQTLVLTNIGTWRAEWRLTENLLTTSGSTTQVVNSSPPPPQPSIDWSRSHSEDILLVCFHPTVSKSNCQTIHTALETEKLGSCSLIPVDIVRVKRGSSLQETALSYRNYSEVAFVEPNYRYQKIDIPNDPSFIDLWGLHNTGQTGGVADADIDAVEAWNQTTGSAAIIVGVIDTGIDYTHEDLVDNLWTNTTELNGTTGVDDDGNGVVDDIYGARWTDGTGLPTSGDPFDGDSHGTHVSGTIGAVGNNTLGVVGVNHQVRIMALKFLDDSGSGFLTDAIAAVEYAVANGAHVTNNSWGGGGFSQTLKDAIEAAGAAGQLFVAAAGNDGSDNDALASYPASYDSTTIISVAASDHSDGKASFSNWGLTSVDLAAPGLDILSTTPGNGYSSFSGTSMATPHVTGVVALLLSELGAGTTNSVPTSQTTVDPVEVKNLILSSVDPIDAFRTDGPTPVMTGGRLNAANALELAGIPWLTETVTSGTLDPGESINIQVTADAAGQVGATHTGELIINYDSGIEPAEDDLSIPIALTVTSAPEIIVSPTVLGFGEVFIGFPQQMVLTVSNNGVTVLDVTDIHSNNSVFAADQLSFQVQPGEIHNVIISFDPLIEGPSTGLLTFASNDPSDPTVVVIVSGTGIDPPNISVSPNLFDKTLSAGEVSTDTLKITNNGLNDLTFSIIVGDTPTQSVSRAGAETQKAQLGYLELSKFDEDPRRGTIVSNGFGGPDTFGYSWIDSNETGGPVFNWIDIASTGTDSGIHSDDGSTVVDLGFSFTYYGIEYSSIMIGENGNLSFNDYGTSHFSNQPIPNPNIPNNIIAPFWDDHYSPGGGTIYYETQGSPPNRQFIVQWDGISHFGSASSIFTYEVILSEIDDSMVFQYLTMTGPFGEGSSATVGIENNAGTDGLEISFNSLNIENNLAIRISAEPIRANPLSGIVEPGSNVDISITFNTTGLIAGQDLETEIVVVSNDPDEPEIMVPINLHIIGPPQIEHTPLADTIDLGPFTVPAEITADFELVRTDLIWRINGGGFQMVSMTPTGGDTYEGVIPAQAIDDIISYYIEVEDLDGNIVVSPDGAPGTNLYEFEIRGIPLLTVDPMQITYDLFTGDSEVRSLVLTNVGSSRANWSLSEHLDQSGSSSDKKVSYQSNSQPSTNWTRPHSPDTLLVRFQPDKSISTKQAVHRAMNTEKIGSFTLVPVDVVRIKPGINLRDVARQYTYYPEVTAVEPNYKYKKIGIPSDPSFSNLWGLHNTGQTGGVADADIDAVEAWNQTTGSAAIIVGVIDTGIDYSHEDLVNNLWTNTTELNGITGVDDDGNGVVDDIYGARWTNGNGLPTSGDPFDGDNHGTHVSGTIGAVGNNALGVVGVNHNVRIMALKFLDDSGSGFTADAIAALEYAVANGAHVTNNSWGGGGFSQTLKDAIEAAGAAGQLFVAAAGNDGSDNDALASYPASYDSATIISVAASDHSDGKASFSNWGLTSVDLAAPGLGILSTIPGNSYSSLSGTSMATPHVTGVVALVLSEIGVGSSTNSAPTTSNNNDPINIKNWILSSVDQVDAFRTDGPTPVSTGGRLNAAKALELAGIPWLTENVRTGGLDPGESEVIQLTADTQGQTTGTHTGTVSINYDDGFALPEDELLIPITLNITDAPSIIVSPTSLNFGNVFVGLSNQLTLTITNEGTTLLTITDIQLDNNEFSVDTVNFQLLPGEFNAIQVTYEPLNAGSTNGLLIVTSDDPSDPTIEVNLSGNGLLVPNITITPQEIVENLLVGETSENIINVSNTGAGELNFEIIVDGNLSASATANPPTNHLSTANSITPRTGSPYSTQNSPIHSLRTKPKPYNRNQQYSSLQNGLLFNVNVFNNTIEELDPSNGTIVNSLPLPESALGGPEGLAFDGTDLYYISGFGSNTIYKLSRTSGDIIATSVIPGLEAIDGLAHSGDDLYALGFTSGTIYIIDFDSEVIASQLSLGVIGGGLSFGGNRGSLFVSYFDVIIYEVDPADGTILNSFVPPNLGTIWGLGYSNALGVLLASNIADGLLYGLDPNSGTVLFSYPIPLGSGIAADEAVSFPWLSIDPLQGTVNPAGTQEIIVGMDATDLIGGDYIVNMIVSSNDPEDSEIVVPIQLNVTGIPDINVQSGQIDFGTQFVGDTVTHTLAVENIGTDSLSVSDIAIDNSTVYTVDSVNFDLDPGQTKGILVTFESAEIGNFNGILTITSNDPDEVDTEITLSAQAVLPPDITVSRR